MVVKALAITLFGAMTTVAVAWACLWLLSWESTSRIGVHQATNGVTDLYVWCHDYTGRRIMGLSREQVSVAGLREYPEYDPELKLPRWSYIRRKHIRTAGWPQRYGVEIQCGWPFSAVACYFDYSTEGMVGALELEPGAKYLPLLPLWRGLAFDTLLYALVLWLLWSAPLTTRRIIRRCCGRCLRCGYDLRHAEHTVCPECGGQR